MRYNDFTGCCCLHDDSNSKHEGIQCICLLHSFMEGTSGNTWTCCSCVYHIDVKGGFLLTTYILCYINGYTCNGCSSVWGEPLSQTAHSFMAELIYGVNWSLSKAVPTSKGQALAHEYGIKFFETSAKTNLNVEEVFLSIARDIKQRLADTDHKAEPSTIKINQDQAAGAGQAAQKSAWCG